MEEQKSNIHYYKKLTKEELEEYLLKIFKERKKKRRFEVICLNKQCVEEAYKAITKRIKERFGIKRTN
jgi:NADH:ubiquinone oxidoreductase subunit E